MRLKLVICSRAQFKEAADNKGLIREYTFCGLLNLQHRDSSRWLRSSRRLLRDLRHIGRGEPLSTL